MIFQINKIRFPLMLGFSLLEEEPTRTFFLKYFLLIVFRFDSLQFKDCLVSHYATNSVCCTITHLVMGIMAAIF